MHSRNHYGNIGEFVRVSYLFVQLTLALWVNENNSQARELNSIITPCFYD